jgi:hypothetical protein
LRRLNNLRVDMFIPERSVRASIPGQFGWPFSRARYEAYL